MGLKVLIVATEVSPYAKSGGLGDVAGSLPKALKKEGVDVRVVFPKYKSVKKEYIDNSKFINSFYVKLGWRNQYAGVYQIQDADVPTYMIENDFYFGRDGYYGYGDDYERFAFFSKAAIEFLQVIDFIPDVIHSNDWQTALVSLYLKDIYSRFVYFKNIKSLFTIHNLQYQGIFDKEILETIDLNYGYFVSDKLEFNSRVSLMKAGLLYSDAVSTVSNTYAYEVQTPQYGYNLDGVLRCRNNVLYGIVNGIDYEANNPATSKKIYYNFDIDNLEKGKRENKHGLQKELGLPVGDMPMISVISRLADQKGINLIIEGMGELMQKDVQFVLLGTGESRYEYILREYENRYRDKVRSNIMFDDTRAQRIYAGSDMFLMPSLFEPCGLGQLFAMSYGTVPIVRTTGGLVDTVKQFSDQNPDGNGFAFQDYITSGMMWGINQALETYYDKDKWNKVVKNAFNTRFSWENSAKEYIKVYKKL